MNELLERRYRTVLRVLPSSYRAEREEEMVAAYLESSGDVPDAVNPYPRWGEVASVIALSTRVRLGGAGASPRFVAWGAAVRLVALCGLGFHAMAGTFTVVSLVPVAPGIGTRPFGVVAAVLWVAAYVSLAAGRARLAKPLACAAGAVVLAELAIRLNPAGPLGLLDLTSPVLNVVVPVTALLLGFHGEAPAPRRPWPWIVAPVAAGLSLWALVQPLLAAGRQTSPALWLWVDLMGPATVALVVAAVVAAARRTPSYVRLALAILGTLTLLSRLPVLTSDPLAFGPREVWVSGVVQCAALAVVVTVMAVAGLRDLPAVRRGRAVT
ncbi:hypothetical protein [Nonomuraea rhizosphaerae]|uniref:hypothetical protein n=1 Tax=Nonomuraea rhizosphaerae TaxID=2665663 RepID=UPI001C5FB6F0|nr:hypothetical protein [Nonomuraea rhizosphaerae]